MRPSISRVAASMAVVSMVILSGCGSEDRSDADGQRSADSSVPPVELCVTGRTGTSMTVQFDGSSGSQGDGPFPLIENSCGRSTLRELEVENIRADVTDTDGTSPLLISATSPSVGLPYVTLECRPGSSNSDSNTYRLDEGERQTFDCDQYAVDVERMTDSGTAKYFQVNLRLR